jgi:DNA-binding transcriptional MerR regulator
MNADRVTLSPSDVARQVGVSTDTLRHYERKGLLPSPVRSSAGYRRYSVETVKRVQLIQRALVIGFSLVDLDDRLRQLSALRIELRHLIADWDRRIARAAGKPAHLLETLGERPIIERQRIDRTARERRPFTRRPNTSRS